MRLVFFVPVFICFAWGCGKPKERPPLFGSDGTQGDGTQGDGAAGAAGAGAGPSSPVGSTDGQIELGEPCEGPPDPDTSLLCGNQVVPVLIEKPNLYFVVDASGSMEERIDPRNSETKIEAVSDAIIEVTRTLGHRISYGLSAFPSLEDSGFSLLGCGPGGELFETRPGDPLECVNRPGGEVHDEFTRIVRDLEVGGGTPLSGTLEALAPTLLALEGQTAIVLLTDGAPNCNPDATCGVDACLPNIEGGVLPSGACTDDFNCCDSAEVSEEDMQFIGIPEAACVDETASLEVVGQFRQAGLLTFVIGVPGSELYADVMTSLADVGGTRREGSVGYYDVDDLDELVATLSKIGTELALGCEVELQSPPADEDLLNVYFDDQVVLRDERNGWTLDGDLVQLHGEACDALSEGKVAQLQLVSGCRTVVR